jgi:hypothetical protein
MKISEEELKNDFILFAQVVWHYMDLPELTRIQKYTAEYMSDSGTRDRMIQAYRGAGKSYLAYAYCVWRIWKDPDIKILAISATSPRADAFSETCQRILLIVPFLNHLIPQGRDVTWTKKLWSVAGTKASGSNTVTSKGITGQITGSRADLIILDDVEIPGNSGTVEQRAKLRESIREVDAIRKGNEKGEGGVATSEVLVLGTPQSFESIYNDMMVSGYDCRIWPILLPTIDEVDTYRGNLCPVLAEEAYTEPTRAGTSVDPLRFTDLEIEQRKARYGRSGFALQFMLNTDLSDADRFPLKLSDFIVYDVPQNVGPAQIGYNKDKRYIIEDLPLTGFNNDKYYSPSFINNEAMVPWERIVMAIDPSGRGTDETTYVVLKSLMGTLYLVDAGGFSSGYDEKDTLIPLAMLAKEHGVQKVYIESNYGDGMFSELLKPVLYPIHPCSIEEVRHNIQKEQRIIDTLEPVMSRHKLVVSRYVIEKDYKTSYLAPKDSNGKARDHYSLFYQITHINRDKGCLVHDDRLDALAMGVASFADKMNRDIDYEMGRLKDERYEANMRHLRNRGDRTIKRLGTQSGTGLGHLSGVSNEGISILDNY